MPRPSIPLWWRAVIGAEAALLLVTFILTNLPITTRGVEPFIVAAAVTGPFLGLALLASLARHGRREALLALGAAALALLFGIVGLAPFMGTLMGLAVFAPLAILVARPYALAALPALAGAPLILVGAALVARSEGPSSGGLTLPAALGLAGGLFLVVAYGAYAAMARTDAQSPPITRRARTALVLLGAAWLAVSFSVGGHWMFIPLWPAALALVALPVFARFRTHALPAAIVATLLLVGIAPVATCTVDPFSDAIMPDVPPDADAYPERVNLLELGGNGPRWASGGGFSGETVACPSWAVALGAAWDVALTATALWGVRRAKP